MPTTMLHIPTADGRANAFAAFPEGGGRHPGVLMYADGFGIRPVLREMARELAGHGSYVLVHNFLYRHGPLPVVELPDPIGAEARPAVLARLMPLIQAHTTARNLSDADAYLDFPTTRPEVAAGPVAVTGYCVGGLLATRTAAAHPRRDHRPLHFDHAESDLTPQSLADLNRILDTAGSDYTSEIHPGSAHGSPCPTPTPTPTPTPSTRSACTTTGPACSPSSTARYRTAEARRRGRKGRARAAAPPGEPPPGEPTPARADVDAGRCRREPSGGGGRPARHGHRRRRRRRADDGAEDDPTTAPRTSRGRADDGAGVG